MYLADKAWWGYYTTRGALKSAYPILASPAYESLVKCMAGPVATDREAC